MSVPGNNGFQRTSCVPGFSTYMDSQLQANREEKRAQAPEAMPQQQAKSIVEIPDQLNRAQVSWEKFLENYRQQFEGKDWTGQRLNPVGGQPPNVSLSLCKLPQVSAGIPVRLCL